jgi:nucleolar GTP-binding protein
VFEACLKHQKALLAYFEEVRKHMSRLPALDPNTRTLLMCGLPSSSKSSFIFTIMRANLDGQPYAFTSKSLFVGHCEYRYLRCHVIGYSRDSDHPLEERNTTKMQAMTALAPLTCSVLSFVDISAQCEYTIEQKCSLFRSILPSLVKKQLIVVVNKVDQQPWNTLEGEKNTMVGALVSSANCNLMTMSNVPCPTCRSTDLPMSEILPATSCWPRMLIPVLPGKGRSRHEKSPSLSTSSS